MKCRALALLLLTGCLEIGDPIYGNVPPEPPRPPMLELVDFAPADNAPDLPPRDPVVFVFDRNLKVGSAKVRLVSDGMEVDVNADYHKGMISLLPRGGFAPGVDHVLTLEAISGEDDALLGAPLVLHFATTADATDPPRFDEIQAIWSGACALSGCHQGPDPQARMDLSKGASRASAVGQDAISCPKVACDFACTGSCDSTGDPRMQRIAPGKPCHSCVMKYLRIDFMPLAKGGEMAMPLPEQTKDRIERWILAGAPE